MDVVSVVLLDVGVGQVVTVRVPAELRSGSVIDEDVLWFAHAVWRGSETASDVAASVGLYRILCDEVTSCGGRGSCAPLAEPLPPAEDGQPWWSAAGASACQCDESYSGSRCSVVAVNITGPGGGGGAGACSASPLPLWAPQPLPPYLSARQTFAAMALSVLGAVVLCRLRLCCRPAWDRVKGYDEDDVLPEAVALRRTLPNALMLVATAADALLAAAPALVIDIEWAPWLPLRAVARAWLLDGLRSPALYASVWLALVASALLVAGSILAANAAAARAGNVDAPSGGRRRRAGCCNRAARRVLHHARSLRHLRSGATDDDDDEDQSAYLRAPPPPRGAGCWLPPERLHGPAAAFLYLLATVALVPSLCVVGRVMQCGVPFPATFTPITDGGEQAECFVLPCWSAAHATAAFLSAGAIVVLLLLGSIGFAAQLAFDAHGEGIAATDKRDRRAAASGRLERLATLDYRPVPSFVAFSAGAKAVSAWAAVAAARAHPRTAAALVVAANAALLLRASLWEVRRVPPARLHAWCVLLTTTLLVLPSRVALQVMPVPRLRWLPRAAYACSTVAAAGALLLHHAQHGGASWLTDGSVRVPRAAYRLPLPCRCCLPLTRGAGARRRRARARSRTPLRRRGCASCCSRPPRSCCTSAAPTPASRSSAAPTRAAAAARAASRSSCRR